MATLTKGLYSGGRASFYDPQINADFATNMWKECPILEILHDPQVGVVCEDSWTGIHDQTGDYTVTQQTTGTAARSTTEIGALDLDSNSVTATQGVQMQRGSVPFIPVSGSKIWAEFKFKVTDTFDKAELFLGIAEIDTTIIGTSALSTANHIGWSCVTDDGVMLFNAEKATVAATPEASVTIAEATYVKLGFFVDGVTSVIQYVNGVKTGSGHATANIPVVAMAPSWVCQSGGTNDPIMTLRAYRIVQLYS